MAASMAMTDEEFAAVLAAAQLGDGTAFEQLYRMLAPAVAGYLRVQGAAEPDDLTSEVFLAVFRGLEGFEGAEAQFRSWVFTIAHRRLTDERRRLGRQSSRDAGQANVSEVGDVEADALARLATARVRELCGRLGPDQRDVLLLRLVAGLTVEEVARVVGRSPGATKALQRRALAALRREIEKEGVPL